MNRYHLFIPDRTPPLRFAEAALVRAGVCIAQDAQEANLLLWPVPSVGRTGAGLLPGQTVVGGKLDFLPPEFTRVDLLKDPAYLWQNAALTAEAALGYILRALACSHRNARILILGWGRIGRCLARQLQALGADVTICARAEEARAAAQALGFSAVWPAPSEAMLAGFRCIVNTVPAVLLPSDAGIAEPCFLLDLASGIFLPGAHVVSARGLPGRDKPEASGQLIARCILRKLKGVEPL